MRKIFSVLVTLCILIGLCMPATTAYAEVATGVSVEVPEKPYDIKNVVSGVHVYWKAVNNVTKYGVWRSETGVNGTYKWIANPGVAHFTDTKVTSGKTYYYKVTSMDPVTGEHSEKSQARGIMYVSTPDITGRENTTNGVKLDWNKIDGASGYRIYRKGYNDASWGSAIVEIAGNETFTWTDTTAENGSVYRYTIRALGGTAKTLSGCRNTGRTMVRLTGRTISEVTASSDTSVRVTWGTTAKADGYEVRFISDDGSVKSFTVGNYKTGVKTFTGLATGKDYQVQVRCYKKVEDVGTFYSAWSDAKTVTLGNGSSAEPAPEDIPTPEVPYKITNVVNGVHVYWKAIEGVAKYGVWRSETGENGTYKWLGNPTTYHFTDKTVESGVTYHYKITVCSEDGKTHGAKSKAIGITYVATPDITGRVNTADGVALTWDGIAGAMGYAIYRKTYEGNDAWVRITTISGNETLDWTDTTAEDGIIYRYTVRALAGSDLKTLSGCRNTGRTMVRLGSSSFTTVEVTDSTSVECTWETLSYVTGYEIRFVNGESKEVFRVKGSEVTAKTFESLEEETSYSVQIRNYKVLDGVGTFYSDWSEPVEVNTAEWGEIEEEEQSKKVTLTGKVSDLNDAEVGDSVLFGTYEQDNNTENGAEPIEWYVLDVQDGKALLLSKYVLYQHYFGASGLAADRIVQWEQSALRNTLNNAFFNAAFSEEDKERVYYVTLETDYNPQYGTSNGNATFDRVFALSLSEAETYFEDYADWVGVVAGTETTANWWLRSRGAGNRLQAILGADGSLQYYGRQYTDPGSSAPKEGVRPAIWVLTDTSEREEVTTNADAIVSDGNKVALEEAYPGAYVSFGKYNQDNDTTNGDEDIEWIVLDVEDGKALLLSRYVLDAVASSPNNVFCSWGTSNVRTWLNGEFYDGAFSEAEKAQIRQTLLKSAPNGKENALNDNVFVLSEKETVQYFKDSRNFTAGSTVHAQKAGAKLEGYGYCKWLLRPESFTGVLSCFGDGVQFTTNSITNSLGIRPAMWVDIETASEKPGPNKFVYPTGELVSIDKAYPGASVQLGNYEQDSTVEGLEPIEWIVLDVQDDKALLLSKYVLFDEYYGYSGLSGKKDKTWEESTLRSNFNNTFFNSAFSEEEKEIICDNALETDYNPRYGSSNGNATKDRVFALSLSEAEIYFENYEDWVGVVAGTENTTNWWLRSRGAGNKLQSIVSTDGYLHYYGVEYDEYGYNPKSGARPAIWVKLQNPNGDPAQTNPDAIVPDGNTVALEDAYPGAYVKFGKYNYDNDSSNGDEDIEWIVLDVEDGKALVLSHHVLEGKSFAANNDLYSWGTSSIRTWLNETFYAGAFSDEEKARINETEIAPPNTSDDEATQDKVFLLSEDETVQYFKYPRNFTINSTYHAYTSGVNAIEPGYCNWLLRPERYTNKVQCFGDGATLTTYAGANTVGIRPAMWLTIETASEEPGENQFVYPTGEEVSIQDAYPGASVKFGTYEQDSETEESEDIEWIVLDVQDDKVLLLSKYVLFRRVYSFSGLSGNKTTTWGASGLRKHLNETFYNTAFSEEEKMFVCETELPTDHNPRCGASNGVGNENGEATVDKVFLLSLSEAEIYFENREDWVGVTAGDNTATRWWLRSKGANADRFAVMESDGVLNYMGVYYDNYVSNPSLGVRPVIWVSKEAIEPTPSPSPTPTPTPEPTPSLTPSPSPTPTPKPTATPTPTPKPTATPLPTATPIPDRDPVEEEIEFLPGDFTYGTKEGYYVCTGLSDSGFEKFEKYLSKDTVTIIFPTVSDTGDEVEGFCSDSTYDLGTLEKQTEPYMRLVFPDTYLVYYGETGPAPERVLSVELGEGLEFIAQKSFYGYTGLTSIVLPESIREYGNQVFDGCTNLVVDTLYTNDVKMGSKVFNGVTINDVVLSESFEAMEPGAGTWTTGTFAGAVIKDITYEEGLEIIPNDAFRDCTSLTTVTVPEGVVTIGSRAFSDCSQLVTLVLPETVEKIEKHAFKDCGYLRKFTVPDTVTEFGTEAFKGCGRLVIEVFDTAEKTVWGEAFSGVTIESIVIRESFNAISPDAAWVNAGAFKGAILEKISFEEGIKKIPDDAFRDCTSITEITIPDTVTVIGMRAFYSCTKLESVILPESVTEIQKQAFARCSVLQEIEITDAVQIYGEEAFYQCPELYIREFNTQTKTICYSVFYGVTIGELIVSKDFIPATEWKENGAFDGALLERLIFEEGMTKIPDYLLRDCGSITELVIPEGVQSIGTRAFFRCSKLERVVLPSSLTEIGEQAFRYCSALNDINVSAGVTVGDNAFADCSSLEVIPQ